MQFVSGEVYPSLIVTAISMYLYAYSCLTFALTLLMHVFFFLAYHYGYRKNHITFKLIGRMGAALCTLAIFLYLSLIHISEPTRLGMISYAVFCLKKKKKKNKQNTKNK
eukprot:TRINITY_DN8139_c0_g1_i7.p1 TRINITY_DN8139_c0_g1~~TRINITY_DN8139_c0_g1_i7.p1  ORF type:complete len:109 (-),score=17.48 TRINITY_DN8139_c0_g1_i7:12-338(-)